MKRAADLAHAPCRPSQRERIFDLLETAAARNQEVPASELATISLQYCARLKELRDLGEVHGFRILNRVQHQDGRVLGYYKLVWDQPRPRGFSVAAAATSAPETTIVQGALFNNPVRYADPEEVR